jgi:hypothetical protein
MKSYFDTFDLKCFLAQLGRQLLDNIQSLQDFQSSLPEASEMIWNIVSLADLNNLWLDLLQVVTGHIGEKLNKRSGHLSVHYIPKCAAIQIDQKKEKKKAALT